MLLVIDCGNTNTGFAVYENTNCVGSWRTSTNISRTADEYAVWLTELLALRGLVINDIKGIIIANVVPETSFNLINYVKNISKLALWLLEKQKLI